MSISKTLLQQAEEATKRADPSLFKKTSPYCLGMEEWFSSDSDEDFQAPRPKKQRKSLSLGNRFEIVSEHEAESSAKGVVPRNTEKNDRWALNTFKAWIK